MLICMCCKPADPPKKLILWLLETIMLAHQGSVLLLLPSAAYQIIINVSHVPVFDEPLYYSYISLICEVIVA